MHKTYIKLGYKGEDKSDHNCSMLSKANDRHEELLQLPHDEILKSQNYNKTKV